MENLIPHNERILTMMNIADQPIITNRPVAQPATIDLAEIAYAIADLTCVIDRLALIGQAVAPKADIDEAAAALARLREFREKLQCT
jgi:hypothetical protein